MTVAAILWMSLVGLCALCAIAPALLFAANLRAFRAPPDPVSDEHARVAVLIPARNEEANIGAALACVLLSEDVDVDVYVLDDASTDRTAAVVREWAASDARVRLLQSGALPQGWNGKQHACWQMAQATTAPLLLFLDADVRVAPQCIARMAAFQRQSGAALVSGFPRLLCVTGLEKLLLPLIHFVLLSFLPFGRMRASADASLAAGCGQFLLCGREAYFACGGHSALRASMHDGLKLPRAFRAAGFRTDLADITALAKVRMYRSAREVWNGLAKNATEGMAAPARIVPFTVLLLCGQVLPWLLTLAFVLVGTVLWWQHAFLFGVSSALRLGVSALLWTLTLVAATWPAFAAVKRFQQPRSSAWFHAHGVLLLVALQWWALLRQGVGHPVGWRARTYAASTEGEVQGRS